MTKIAIVIPARLASSRLPYKPLVDINGKTMIEHVIENAVKSNIGDVLVACDDQKVKEIAENTGVQAILTDSELPSGSDRVWQAINKVTTRYDIIINLQGDEPLLTPKYLRDVVELMKDPVVDIGTIVAPLEEDPTNPNVVKAVLGKDGRVMYCSRQPIPFNAKVYYHHIGLYAYRYAALKKFISLECSTLEKQEKLEQLRALEDGMSMSAYISDKAPIGVDTLEDLSKVREILRANDT